MPVIAYPDHLPTFLKASKTRRQAAPFSAEEARRGHAYFKATGPDNPVYWDVTFRFNRFQAIQFWLWFTLKLRRGINEFTIPIDTEGTLSTHRCRFVPDSLLPAQEYGGVWTYTATIEARLLVQAQPSGTVLLDTFTAADGSDPTSRDMDVHPSGKARWVFDASTSGVIRSNSLRLITGNVGDNCYLLYQLPAFTEIFGTTPFATVIEAASFGHTIRLYGYNTAGTSELILNWVGDQLELYVSDESANFAEIFAALPNNGAQHAFAFWTDGTSQKLVIDGIESGSELISLSGISINWLRLELFANGTPETPDFINRVGIYNGLTLAETIALTT